VHITNNIR